MTAHVLPLGGLIACLRKPHGSLFCRFQFPDRHVISIDTKSYPLRAICPATCPQATFIDTGDAGHEILLHRRGACSKWGEADCEFWRVGGSEVECRGVEPGRDRKKMKMERQEVAELVATLVQKNNAVLMHQLTEQFASLKAGAQAV